jgi:hypothetical protein
MGAAIKQAVETDELKILLALESQWRVSYDGREFQTFRSTDISVDGQTIRLGKWVRKIEELEWLRPNIVRIRARGRLRSKPDIFTMYPGDRLPSAADLRRRRRAFQSQLEKALMRYFGTRSIQRQSLYTDRTHGIGGAYPRFLIGSRAVIAVDPDESSATVNAVLRSAVLWSRLVRRRIAVVIPQNRAQTLQDRLDVLANVRRMFDWLQWNGEEVTLLGASGLQQQTAVHEYAPPNVATQVAALISSAGFPLHAVPNISSRAVSIRFRGIEVALVREGSVEYPLGQPVQQVVEDLASVRQHGSSHPLARAHEERWLESNVIGDIGRVLPSIHREHVYPQVPSFVGAERNIIDILTVTQGGRLVVMEIKASPDPDLPFQGLDYWIAVERHRKAGDFQRKGYFGGVTLRNEPALLVLVAPLLAFHKTFDRLVSLFPKEVPLMQLGLNQTWKKEIKILRRKGLVG